MADQSNSKLQTFYDGLKSANIKVPDYATFESTLQDPDKASAFYKGLKEANVKLPDYETFTSSLGLKKKDATDLGLPTSEAFSQILGTNPKPISPDKKETEPKIDPEKRIKGLLADAKPPKNPFLQPAESTSVNNQFNPVLPKTQTLGEYLKEKGVTLNQLELPQDTNPDRELRDGEQVKFDQLLKAKGLAQPPETSYFWGTGKEIHKAFSGVFRDLDDASKTLSNITGLKHGGIFGDIANWIDKGEKNLPEMPNTEVGRLLGSAIGLEPMFIEMAGAPEMKFGKAFGQTITASRFFLQQAGKGFVNNYANQLEQGTPGKALGKGFIGAGEGALTATVFSKLGYGSSKLGEVVKGATGSGVAGGLTSMIANSTGFMGYTLAEMIAKGQPLDKSELSGAGELGLLMTVPEFAKFAMSRATGNYLMSSPAAEEAASKLPFSVPELRNKTMEIREKAKNEPDLQKRATQEMIANTLDGLGDINVIANEVRKNPAAFTDALGQSDLTPEQQKIFKDKIKATEIKWLSTPEITKINNDIESLKKSVKEWEEEKGVPEATRNAKIDELNGQIRDKTSQIKDIINSKAEEDKKAEEESLAKDQEMLSKQPVIPELKLGEKSFASKDELFQHLDKVAIDEKGTLDKTWFDREMDSWPGTETVRAINEWTDAKKAEIKAKNEQAKLAALPPEKIKPLRAARKVLFKPGSRSYKAVNQTPNNFTEAALQFFVNGGRINTDDFIRHSGYEKGTAEFKKYFGLLSKNGVKLDVFHESLPESFGMEEKGAMDMINEVVDLMKSHNSRGQMLTELERRQKGEVQLEPTEEEIQNQRDQIVKNYNSEELDNYDISEYEQAFADGKLNKNDYEELTKRFAEDEQRRGEEENLDSEILDNEQGPGYEEIKPEPSKPAGPPETKPSAKLWTDTKDTPESVRGRFGIADQEFTSEDVDNIPRTPLWEQNGSRIVGVDDNYMKTHFYSNWTEGGNSAVYPEWNPQGEIHIANNVDDEYKPFVAAHEIWEEYKVEQKGLKYSSAQGSAHEQSNKMEIPLRRFYDETLKPKGGKVLSINVTDEGFDFKYKETAEGPEKEATMFPDGTMKDGKHGNDLGGDIGNRLNEKPFPKSVIQGTVYHGGKKILEQGDLKGIMYFSEDKDFSSGYSTERHGQKKQQVTEARIDIKNPASYEIVRRAVIENGGDPDADSMAALIEVPGVVESLKKQGYDGAILNDFGFRNDFEEVPVQIVFDADKQVQIIQPTDETNKPSTTIGKGEGDNVSGGTETVKKPATPKGEEKPTTKYTPEQQTKIDAINKEYDGLIAEKQAIIPKAEADMKKALLEADARNGLFGDTKPLEPDEIIKREEQGFVYNEETRAAIRKPFEEKIAEARKEIANLNKERDSKIGEVTRQQTLGFEESPLEKMNREAKESAESKIDYQGFWNDVSKSIKEPQTKEEKIALMNQIENTVEKGGWKFEVDWDEDPDFTSVNIYYKGEPAQLEELPKVMKKIFDTYTNLLHESHPDATEISQKPFAAVEALKTEAYKQADKLVETSKTGRKLADMHDLINHQIDIDELKSLLDHPYIKGHKELTQDAWAKIQHIQRHPELYEAQKEKPTEKPKGVEFDGRYYKNIDEVQEDFADGKLTFEEQKPLLDKVRKFEEQEIKNRIAKNLEDLAENLGAIKKFEGGERETIIKNLMDLLKNLADLTKLKGEQLLAKLKEYLKEDKRDIPDDVINEAFNRHNAKTPESKLVEALKSIPDKKVPIKERLQLIKDKFSDLQAGTFKDNLEGKLANLKENVKAVWKAYSGMPEVTDYKKALGDWSLAKQINDKALMDFTNLAEKKIPLSSRREAIVNYIEADGDIDLLKKREEGSKKNFKQGYKDAQNLTPDEIKIANSMKEYFDSMLKNGFDAGILKSMVENYVTHFGIRPDDPKVTKVIGGFDNGKLNTTFKYAKGRIYKTFFDLEQAGLRGDKDFKNIIPAYSKGFNRTIYSRAFIKNLTEGKAEDGRPIIANAGMGSMTGDENISKAALVNPYAKPEEVSDYRYINHPAFRDWFWATKAPDGTNVFAKGELVVHPDYATKLSNILGKSDLMKSIPFRDIAKGVNVTKQTIFMLSPFFHYIQEGFHAIGHTVNPIWGFSDFDPKNVTHQKLIKGGLQLYDFHAKSNFAEGLASLNIAGKIPLIKDTILPMQEYLFNEYIPKLKLTTAEHMVKRNLKRYGGKYSEEQIYQLSANQANAAYGNLNYAAMGRNPTVQHLFRTIALAPDFLEARTRFVGQALTPKGAEQRRALVILAGTMFVASRILNKMFDDDYHWDRPFSFIYNKNEYTLRSVPEDMFELFNDPRRFTYNRLSPLFRSVAIEGLTRRDYQGIPESTTDWLKSIVTSPMPTQITRMLPAAWGNNPSDNKLWDDFTNTIGLRERHYFTPLEKNIRNTYYDRYPRGKQSENQKNKMQVRRDIYKITEQSDGKPLSKENKDKMTDLINENVKNNKITIFQGQDLLDNIGADTKDINVIMYNRLPEDDKEDLYNKMSDAEKKIYPTPKSIYFVKQLKEQNKDVYDKLIEFGGFKDINRITSISSEGKKVELSEEDVKRFNETAVNRFGQNVKNQIGMDKATWESAQQRQDTQNPDITQLQARLRRAWDQAVLQTKHDFKPTKK